MFGAIVPYYDMMNHLMSFGRDLAWRRLAARLTCLPPDGRALDVGAGTGDLSLAVAREYPSAWVVALDFNGPMIERGQEKASKEKAGECITYVLGDALQLPFPAGSFDAVTSAFLMRNVADVERTFVEMARVAKPGGRVVCLELTQPTWPFFRQLFWWYFGTLVPWMGRLISRHRDAYRYLPESLARFVSADELKKKMEKAGLCDVTYRKLMAGAVAIHVGAKPHPQASSQ